MHHLHQVAGSMWTRHRTSTHAQSYAQTHRGRCIQTITTITQHINAQTIPCREGNTLGSVKLGAHGDLRYFALTKQMIFVAFCAEGNHSENQLSLSFGMFVCCCHTATPCATSCSRTWRQIASQFVLLENTKSKISSCVFVSVSVCTWVAKLPAGTTRSASAGCCC